MTKDRAIAVITATPFGGDYSSRMTPQEHAYVWRLWQDDPSDRICFAAIVRRIADGRA